MELSRNPVISPQNFKDKKIQVELKENFTLQGTLENFDKFNNLTLKNASQISSDNSVDLGTVYINGHNLIQITELEN